jgi:hypothetical protein
MNHRGVECTLVRIDPGLWQWRFQIGETVKTGKTETSLKELRNYGNYGDSALNLNPPLRRKLVWSGWFWAALAWFEKAPGHALEAGEEAIVSERSSNALRFTRAIAQIRLR